MRPVLFGLGKSSQQTNQSQVFTRKPSGTAVPGAEWKNLAPASPKFYGPRQRKPKHLRGVEVNSISCYWLQAEQVVSASLQRCGLGEL